MNKKMRELLEKIEQKNAAAKEYLEGENKDVDKATALLDEADALEKEYAAEKRLFEKEKVENTPDAEEVKEAKKVDPVAEFGKAAKQGFKVKDPISLSGTLNETTNNGADGGYTVPPDILTQVQYFREAEFSFLDLVRRETVRTPSGQRTFKKRAQYTGFTQVGEGQAIGATATPQFERQSYRIKKYAGYMPMTNELRYDSDANVGQIVIDWLAKESRATANNLILAQVKGNGTAVDFENLDGIKKALNVDLALFKDTSKIITNNDGLQWLDTLKDKEGDYLLSRNPSDPMRMQLAAGARVVEVIEVPNQILGSTTTYSAATDTTVQSGTTYYTRSGAGTTASPYVYTEVEEPTGNPSTSSYFVADEYPQVPFIIGDLFEGVTYWDREYMSIAESAIAAIGDLNAFEQDLTLYRAIEREDVTLRDNEAFVFGYIVPAPATTSGE